MSRPGGKKRGVKGSKSGRKHPEKSVPFPRDTVPVRTPAWTPGMSVERANQLWAAWCRIAARLRQFTR